MLYKLAHILRDNFAWLWDVAEAINSFAFRIRYSGELKQIDSVMGRFGKDGMLLRQADVKDAEGLSLFFAKQPESDFEFFRPHGFDADALKVLLKRTSFMMFVVEKDGEIVGYFFLRSFVHGVTYLGKMVDHNHQGKGIGKMMCKAAMEVALTLGVRMYESINKNNMASMRSTGSVLKQVIIEELEHGDLLIEDLPLD